MAIKKAKPKAEAWKGVSLKEWEDMRMRLQAQQRELDCYIERFSTVQSRIDRKNAMIRDLVTEIQNARHKKTLS
jgi:hypothetical protein